MVELIVFLVGLFFIVAPAVSLYLAGQARKKANEVQFRVSEAEIEIDRLHRQVEKLSALPSARVGDEPVQVTPEPFAEASAASIPLPSGAESVETSAPAPSAETAAPLAVGAEPLPDAERGPESDPTGGSEPPLPPEPAPPAPPPKPPIRINWEHWIGVRGAAVLGGIVLALAAILFLKFSIERGLIPPIVRVSLAVLTGIGALVGSEWLRKRDYEATANAISGAGIVVLYASIWAARILYELIPIGVAFVFMVLVTLVCGLLSWRHRSLVISILGLTGGFVTPLLLSTGQDRPIGLFGYILLLDFGLLALARKRGWPILAALSLLGTALYEALWIFTRMDSDRAFLGLAILAIFGILYAVTSRFAPAGGEGDPWRLTSFSGVLLPFAFAVYFAGRTDLGEHLWPIAMLMALLAGAALWLARLHRAPAIASASAAAVVAVVLVWTMRTDFSTALAWEAAGLSIGLALLFHLIGGGIRETDDRSLPSASSELIDPPFIVAGGLLLILLFGHFGEQGAGLWPWLTGWVSMAGLLYVQGSNRRCSYRRPLAAAALGTGFVTFLMAHGREESFPDAGIFFGLAILLAVILQLVAMRDRRPYLRQPNEYAAAVLPIALLFGILSVLGHPVLSPGVFMATTIVCAFLVALAATRLRLGPLYLGIVGLLALAHTIWVDNYIVTWTDPSLTVTVLAILSGTLLLFTFWPLLAGKMFAADRWALYGAALAAPAWFFALRKLVVARFGDGAIGVLPIALGLTSLAAAVLARRLMRVDQPEGKRSLVWFLAVALSFVTLAIPLQLDKEWVTIGWALQGLAMIALWKRLDHPGLKYFGLALLAVVTVRLVANPAILGYYPSSAWPVFNWLMYTYLVPAAALIGSARMLAAIEVERLRPWEKRHYPREKALAAASCGIAAVMVVFVWINLTILDYFSSGTLTLNLERMPARDLTISVAWALYAITLLAIGLAKKSVVLRWVSLAFLILTIGKVFLYDLGELKDLYRVASLVGLAASLIAVSLAYQKFVFPRDRRRDQK